MKQIIALVILLAGVETSFGQTFEQLLTAGKNVFNNERARTLQKKASYTRAIELLTKAIQLNPDNPQAHYFLGRAMQYENYIQYADVKDATIQKTIAASNEQETVIRLLPNYTEESAAHDPYTEILVMWGYMAFAYEHRNQPDSSKWALTEGMRRGGFREFPLSYYRLLLQHCEANAIYFSMTEVTTMYIRYLQQVEHLRQDVVVISTNMLAATWYAQLIARQHPWLFSPHYKITDTTLYGKWEHNTVVATKDKKSGKSIFWMVPSRDSSGYMYHEDFAMLDIVEHNEFVRPIYYQWGTSPEKTVGLTEHLSNVFYFYKLTTEANPQTNPLLFEHAFSFPFETLSREDRNCATDAEDISWIRSGLMSAINELVKKDRVRDAKTLLDSVLEYMPVSKYPFTDQNTENFYYDVKEYFDSK